MLGVATQAGEHGSQGARRRHVGLGAAVRDGRAVGHVARRGACTTRRHGSVVEQQVRGGAAEALPKAVELDPNFGIGYQGLAVASRNLGQLQDAEKYVKEALRHLDGMTERERYRTRGFFYSDHRRLPAVREGIRRSDRAIRGRRVGAQQPRAVLDAAARHAAGAWRRCGRSWRSCPSARSTGSTWRCTRPTQAISRRREQEARALQELGSLSGCWRWRLLSWDRASWRRRPRPTEKLGNDRRAGRVATRRPASATWRCTRAVSRTRCESSNGGAAADLTAKNADRAAAKLAALAYAHLLAAAEGRGDRRRREGAGEQQGGEDPIPGGANVRRGRRRSRKARR